MYNSEVILSPIMVSGIIGTTLSLAVFSIFQNSKVSIIWVSPKYLNLFAATFFILSYFSTIGYIMIMNELLLKVSLVFLLAAGIFLFLSILYLFKLHIAEEVENQIKQTPQMKEFFEKKVSE